jgi:hypothetical protein
MIFVEVSYRELCGVGFEGGEAVAEVSGRAVRGRLRTEETAERRAREIWPSRMSS